MVIETEFLEFLLNVGLIVFIFFIGIIMSLRMYVFGVANVRDLGVFLSVLTILVFFLILGLFFIPKGWDGNITFGTESEVEVEGGKGTSSFTEHQLEDGKKILIKEEDGEVEIIELK